MTDKQKIGPTGKFPQGKLNEMTEPELKKLMENVATYVSLMTDSLFMLVVFDDSGVAQYVSNANRQDCIKAMKETARRLENKEDIPR